MRLYESLVRRLYQVNLFHPAKMGLTNIQRLHEALGRPTDGLPAVHIAGTNGKGSVALKMARSLQQGGKKTGLFVSPHVSCFRERMQVNGELISEKGVEELLPKIFALCESKDIPATFFEITTALAFQHFRDSDVDAIVIEAGLGGIMDATNIIMPTLSVITSVGLDHTRILGGTVEEIALNKAGIIKPGIPILAGEGCPVELLESVAEKQGSPFFRCVDVLGERTPPAAEDFDEENSRIAEAALRILFKTAPGLTVDETALRKGVSQRPPCRFEVLQIPVEVGDDALGTHAPYAGSDGGDFKRSADVTVVLDVAHNPPAVVRFFEKVAKEFPKRSIRVVAAFSGDKDSAVCLSTILKHVDPDKIHLCEASTPRATPAANLASKLGAMAPGSRNQQRVRSGDQAVRKAMRDALSQAALAGQREGSEREVVVVCGTIFMMVDARQELGIDEPRDSAVVAEVAGSHFRAAQDNVKLSSGTA